MDRTELMYEFHTKEVGCADALRQAADHAVKEIKSAAGWDTDVQVRIEPEVKDKNLFSVSISVFGFGDSVIVRKVGKNTLAVFRKVKKTVLRKIHQLGDQRIASRRRLAPREQFAS